MTYLLSVFVAKFEFLAVEKLALQIFLRGLLILLQYVHKVKNYVSHICLHFFFCMMVHDNKLLNNAKKKMHELYIVRSAIQKDRLYILCL